MRLDNLRVIHLLKDASQSTSARAPVAPQALHVDSCLRQLWVDCLSKDTDGAGLGAPFDVRFGIDAYAFLLSVASGLESPVLGETDIFGQIKDAWKKRSAGQALRVEQRELSGWIQRVFEDTKEIRALFLQNLAGSLYGSLLRKILKDGRNLQTGPTLLVGAGALASSVAPYLAEKELWIANRSQERARALAAELSKQNPKSFVKAIESSDEIAALAQAEQVVLCVPRDSERDPARIAALSCSRARVVHLGLREAEASEWKKLERFHSLDGIFRLDRSVTQVRSLQVDRARAACREKARLRALGGGSSSIAHGWEDLAAFAL